jgi:hypothetical protein
MVTCTSFSASANVPAETGGPLIGPVPNVGGAPGVDAGAAGPIGDAEGDGDDGPPQAAAAATAPSGAARRNSRRVFMALVDISR